jgi:hypothetical protein
MADPNGNATLEFEMLRRFGAKWAVLAAMTADIRRKGIALPPVVFDVLKTVRGKIESGCFSTCEIGCDLSQAEGPIFSECHHLDEHQFQEWSDLLGEAMQGKLDYQRILGVPALEPVKNDCGFLSCNCSSTP